MSYSKEDHVWSSDQATFFEQKISEKIAEILHREHEAESSPVKKISRRTGVAVNTVKKWYSGQNPPRLAHFLILARHYQGALQLLLEAVGGSHLWEAYTPLGSKLKTLSNEPTSCIPIKIYSTENCTINLSIPLRIAQNLNVRQLWFLSQLHDRKQVRADDIVTQWNISLVSAKTDIARMTSLKLVRFVGAKKNGAYILVKPNFM